MAVDLDLGHGHLLRYFSWSPDRDLNPQYDGIPDVERAGAIIDHDRPDDGRKCSGAVHFDHPVIRRLMEMGALKNEAVWSVPSMNPLTLEPSILCKSCGDHGFIREGRWVPA